MEKNYKYLKFKKKESLKTSFPILETKRNNLMEYPKIDKTTENTFLYVNNNQIRDYQINISFNSVKNNTLVVLPTGLGKTFIAGILIFNFYRWFPTGKIIFIAPSKPLVSQQLKGIQSMTQINPTDICELTGSNDPKNRKNLWNKCRIFFATSQTVQNDIEKNICPCEHIVLLIIDEAHHAQGDHSYCKVVSGIAQYTSFFRIIALSATPGSKFDQVQQVIFNLMISKIESRTDEDCKQYIMNKEIQQDIIPDGEGVKEIIARINGIIQNYLKILSSYNLVAHTDPNRTSKGQITILKKNEHQGEASQYITSTIRLLKFREYLQNYSIIVFLNEYKESLTNPEFSKEEFMIDLSKIVKIAESLPQVDPKMLKLNEIVSSYLEKVCDSRVIIFCNYRKIVKDIVRSLSNASPLIKCSQFIGQSKTGDSKGFNQTKQIKIMESFKKGILNVLVATSIGEEGLDIGEVDLIICYDIQKSVIRTVQRMGRTGRKRDGKVHFLLSEYQKDVLKESNKAHSYMNDLISKKMDEFIFFESNPMVNSDLSIVEKYIDFNPIEQINLKKESKRITLLNTEIEELNNYYGENCIYPNLNLSNNIHYIASSFPLTKIKPSNENKLLIQILNTILNIDILKSQNLRLESTISSNLNSLSSQKILSSNKDLLNNISESDSFLSDSSFEIDINENKIFEQERFIFNNNLKFPEIKYLKSFEYIKSDSD